VGGKELERGGKKGKEIERGRGWKNA